jgi:integrase
MSVYKRTGAETYSYDFHIRGRRFSGDTGATSKREAKSIEAGKKADARARIEQEAEFFAGDMTFEIAASRWWIEVGQYGAAKNHPAVLRDLDWLKEHIGARKPVREISDNMVAGLVAKRRGEYRFGNEKFGLVSPSTVNRTCTQRLREIIIRARDVWGVPVAKISFGKHLLKEPQERVREASAAEEEAMMEELAPGYDDAVTFAFLSGCRRMEILGLEWPHVDFFSRRFTVTGKGNKTRTIPMSQAIFDVLWKQKDHHPVKVFTYVARRTLKHRKLIKGKRYPLTEAGLKTAVRRALPDAGIENFRFHDMRHTAATRALRVSNLKVVQKLLGHASIETTTKYAHAMDDDIRDALDAMSAPKITTQNHHEDPNRSSQVTEKKG